MFSTRHLTAGRLVILQVNSPVSQVGSPQQRLKSLILNISIQTRSVLCDDHAASCDMKRDLHKFLHFWRRYFQALFIVRLMVPGFDVSELRNFFPLVFCSGIKFHLQSSWLFSSFFSEKRKTESGGEKICFCLYSNSFLWLLEAFKLQIFLALIFHYWLV